MRFAASGSTSNHSIGLSRLAEAASKLAARSRTSQSAGRGSRRAVITQCLHDLLRLGRSLTLPAPNFFNGLRAATLGAGFCLVGLVGCVSPQPRETSVTSLAARLQELSPLVAPDEAARAAEVAHSHSIELAGQYRVARPAILHNVFVNLGLRKRGLCFQWADDLSASLQSLGLRTLQVRRGVARWETLREHSSVVLTAPGQPFSDGIVLDAWRHSGRLYWSGVRQDKYPWIEVEVIPEEEKRAQAGKGGSP
jgi:hypothetical protein